MIFAEKLQEKIFDDLCFKRTGRVKNIIGTTIEVDGFDAPINSRCSISYGKTVVFADVVGFNDGITLLQPLSSIEGLRPNSKVTLYSESPSLKFSDEYLGCVIDPLGQILIGKKSSPTMSIKTNNPPLKVNERGSIDEIFQTGVCAIDSMFTIGYGQRIGLFAGTGVGKSMLLGMITRFSCADVVVIGLIGERGREVYEFATQTLTQESRKKCVIVAAPADYAPILRMQGADVATAIAEHYRDKGLNVLLLIDSVTRYAQAQREVALASGEAPATKGYPASVFAKLPFLIERAGKSKKGSSITAIYTVLTEGDDFNDPVADSARGVLDGHIILSRAIASKGIYPAIDVPNSLSRLAQELCDKSIFQAILNIKEVFSLIAENEELYTLGLIERGVNLKLDKAMELKDELLKLVKQDFNEKSDFNNAINSLTQLNLKIKQ